uniref:Uncharacterized protein n=1 Tax=Peronospora matthiolae TaxID=2874970 RepID=A0AAV1TY19_9STRA
MACDISARIIEAIISDIFFCDDYSEDGVVNTTAKLTNQETNPLRLFNKKEDDSDWCQVTIKNVTRFI